MRDVRKARDNDQGEGARGDRVMGERGRETSERGETAIRERGRDRVMGERGRETSERGETAIRERGRGEIG